MYTVTRDTNHKDLLPGESLIEAKYRYLKLWGNFEAKMPRPIIENYSGNRMVLRADLAPAGLKSYGAEKLVATTDKDVLVYVAPRVGHAPDAIAQLASMYGKRCVFFCPASKKPSNHQAALLAYDNVELRFIRIAAMPVLNGYAKKWAADNDAAFLPFGLTGTPVVTAGLVKLCQMITEEAIEPAASFCAVSTGTMIRALQIGWPRHKAYGIAVARNMHPGEIGKARVFPHKLPFLRDEVKENQPPFESTANYDAKAWRTFVEARIPNSIFINVGSDDHIERNLGDVDIDSIDSAREWHDMRDMRPL